MGTSTLLSYENEAVWPSCCPTKQWPYTAMTTSHTHTLHPESRPTPRTGLGFVPDCDIPTAKDPRAFWLSDPGTKTHQPHLRRPFKNKKSHENARELRVSLGARPSRFVDGRSTFHDNCRLSARGELRAHIKQDQLGGLEHTEEANVADMTALINANPSWNPWSELSFCKMIQLYFIYINSRFIGPIVFSSEAC